MSYIDVPGIRRVDGTQINPATEETLNNRNNKAATLRDYLHDVGEKLYHITNPIDRPGDRLHIRGAEGASYLDPVWEVYHFDNTNCRAKYYSDQIYTDWAEVPSDTQSLYTTLDTGPYAYYAMDEGAGASTLLDSSGNGRDGTYGRDGYTPNPQQWDGPQLYRGAPGSFRAWDNTRSGAYPNVDWSGWSNLTFSLWGSIKYEVEDPTYGVFVQDLANFFGGRSTEIVAERSGSKYRFRINMKTNVNSNKVDIVTGYDYDPDVPFHLVLTYSPGIGRMYLDGVQHSTDGGGTKHDTGSPYRAVAVVEYRNNGVGGTFNPTRERGALVAGIGIWNRTLSAQEVLDIYNAGKL